MSNDESRRQLEEWWRTQRKVSQFVKVGSHNGPYNSSVVQGAWIAWQDSREAMAVENGK